MIDVTKTRLTDLAVRQLPFTKTGQVRYWDTITPGFGLTVGKRTKTFICMTGQQRRLQTLGRYPHVSVQEARRQAQQLKLAQHTPHAIHTLREAISAYYDDLTGRVRPNTITEYKRHLKHAPDVRLDELSKDQVPLTEPHAINAWKVFYNWCIKQELTTRNPFLHLQVKYGQRSRVLSPDELATIWQYEHPPFSHLVKLLILTGQRRTQIWKLQPDWIEGDLVTFPAEYMKGGQAHTIPLGPLALTYTQHNPFTFNSWSKAKARLDQHTGVTDWTIHDLRRTFVTLAASFGIPLHVTEQYVAHRSGTISGIAALYNRHTYIEEMREAVSIYEDKLATLLSARAN